MGKRKELSVAQRGTIFYCHKRGDSNRTIAKTVGCHHSTVSATLKRYAETGTLNSGRRIGRPHLVDKQQLKRLVTDKRTRNRRLCTAGVAALWKEKTGQSVSARTIGRQLRRMGLKNCVARKKPLVTRVNKEARLAWCLNHENWTTQDWAKVLWSDEATFSQFQQSRSSRVWREPKDEWAPSCVAASVKHSPSRMFWGCFSRQGLGPLVPLVGSVTGVSHVETLRHHAVPTFRQMFPKGEGWFQEDNARPHKAKVTIAFREENALRTLPWPAQSPDLNPIENLWAEIKRQLHNLKQKPSNIGELEKCVEKLWRAIPSETIENLVDSMPRRIEAVIAANGGPTKY